MNSCETEALLSAHFKRAVVVCVATPEMYKQPLFPAEEQIIASSSISRKREFIGGRACARKGLRKLGLTNVPILRDSTRAPVWPIGITGSITHCEKFCCAVLAAQSVLDSVGIDAETVAGLSPELCAVVCRADEQLAFACLPKYEGLNWEKVAFSAKEAFYKCYFQMTRTFLEFNDVSIQFTAHGEEFYGTFGVTIHRSEKPLADRTENFEGFWLKENSLIYTGCSYLCNF